MNIILLFPGQGAQVVGMGKAWYDFSDTVKHYFDVADKILPFKLGDLCFNGPAELLQETRICQPALFVVGYGIFDHLRKSGAFDNHRIVASTGISLGELTSLAAADVFDFETGLKMVAERGRLMQEACDMQPTGMLALIAGTDESIQKLCQDFDLDVSNKNCPGQTVVSGLLENLEKAQFVAKERGFKMAIPLKVAGAYHSRWMQPARAQFESYLKQVHFQAPKLEVLTNTTGLPVSDPEEIRKALGVQLTSTVLFEKCLHYCGELDSDICLECGPGNVVAGLAKRTTASLQVKSAADTTVLQLF